MASYDHWAGAANGQKNLEAARAVSARLGESGQTPDYLRLSDAVQAGVGSQLKLVESFGIVPASSPASGALPRGSLYLSFEFTLAGPYLSRDDRSFHLLSENPVRREWAFWVPMVSGTTWKGNIRSAATILAETEENKAKCKGWVDELFGPRREEGADHEEDLKQGRVQFFPTYFDRVDADVINPRKRTTRKGTSPIPMERVPGGSKGRFAVLYLPFDLLHRADKQSRIEKDLRLLGAAIGSMLLESGFGGKKTLPNYGTAENGIGNVVLADEKGGIEVGGKITMASELWRLPELTRWGA